MGKGRVGVVFDDTGDGRIDGFVAIELNHGFRDGSHGRV